MNFGKWHILGISTKQSEVLSEIKKVKLVPAILKETKIKGHGSAAIEDYIH